MIWLAGQLWPLLLASLLLGAATVVVWGQRRESVEVWEDVPVPPPVSRDEDGAGAGEPGTDPDSRVVGSGPTGTPASVGTPVPIDADDPDSPFPVAAQGGPAPWEADELWSRPARVGAQGEARRPKDEWAEAAENWRSWADEATGRGFAGVPSGNDPVSARDRDLFAADRDVESPRPPAGTDGGAAASSSEQPGSGDDDGPEEPTDVFPAGPDGAEVEEDVFPYARPVEAPRGGEGTMDPMDPHEMTEDEREAAEIRRMREQARRGDGA